MDKNTPPATRKYRVTISRTVRDVVTVEVDAVDTEGLPLDDDDCRYLASKKAFSEHPCDWVVEAEPVDD